MSKPHKWPVGIEGCNRKTRTEHTDQCEPNKTNNNNECDENFHAGRDNLAWIKSR